MSNVIEIQNFHKEVIEESYKTPVIVDFWAAWCGPCRTLGPVLEDIARTANGNFKIVKLNTEEFPEIAAKYQIRSIPAVKLFIKGEVKAEFLGALPKSQIEKWISTHIPSEEKKELEAIKEAIQQGKGHEMKKKLEKLIDNAPGMNEAKLLLASLCVFTDAEKALDLVKNIYEDSPFYQTATFIKYLAEFGSSEKRIVEIMNPVSREKFRNALAAYRNNDYENVISTMIDLLQTDKGILNEMPRKTCIALFNLLGHQHDLTRKYRRKFDMSLY